MATLEAYSLLQAGVHTTQASAPKTGGAQVSLAAIMPDSTILDATPLLITTLAIEQSLDDGLTWGAMAKIGWNSDPETPPHPATGLLSRPGIGVTVPNDGNTRRFRARLDIPQAMLIGLDVTVA